MTFGVTQMRIPRVRAGDPVTAESWNQLVDAAEQLTRQVGEPTQTPIDIVFAELTEDVDQRDTNKAATVLSYDSSNLPSNDPFERTGRTINNVADGHDGPYLGPPSGSDTGERHFFFHYRPDNFYLPITHPGPHVGRVNNSGNIDKDASGLVDLWAWSAGALQVTSPAISVTAYNWTSHRIWDNNNCVLTFHPQSRQWFIVSSYTATMMKGQLLIDLDTTDAQVSVDNLVAIDGHYTTNGSITASETVTAHNVFSFSGSANDPCFIIWHEGNSQWELVQIGCP